MSKERICRKCAWFGTDALCHYEPERLAVLPNYWCRHWSETTGWDVFEQLPDPQVEKLKKKLRLSRGLNRTAADMFRNHILFKRPPDQKILDKWLEEWDTQC